MGELNRDTPLRLLTKGDNNLADDTELYAKGQDYLTRSEDVIGSVVGYVPVVGYVNDFAVRASVAQEGAVGDDGGHGGFAKRVTTTR